MTASPCATRPRRRAARTLGAIARALENADGLILATDPDREGEAIAWQVLDWLEERDAIGGSKVERAAFHEVTEEAVRAALDNPRELDMDLVQAWQARRALDYLVGYGLSPVLWRKLPGCRSAGRVQSVALRLICEREAGIEAFVPRQYWTVEAEAAAGDGGSFAATLVRLDGTAIGDTGMAGEAAAREAVGRIREARFRAVAVERDTLHRPPNPPFATATLQLAAFRRLGLGVGETMAIAQRLYEGVDLGAETTGLITYPRTDSAAMAGAAVAQARAAIAERFGADCVPARPRTFRTRARNAQEAHEAIRPTGFGRTPEAVARHLDRDAAGLYGLIWRRALASQMAAARVERVRIELAGEDGAVCLAAECSAMVFDGHFRLAPPARGPGQADRDPGIRTTGGGDAGDAGAAGRGLPALEAGEWVTVRAVRAERHVAAPPGRHTEAGLVRRLEERGIGRPARARRRPRHRSGRDPAPRPDRLVRPERRTPDHGPGRTRGQGETGPHVAAAVARAGRRRSRSGAPPARAAPAGRPASGDRRADPRRHRPLRPLGAPCRDLCRDPGRRRAGRRDQPRRRPDRRQGDPAKPRPRAEAGAGQARPAPRRRRAGLAEDRPLRPLSSPTGGATPRCRRTWPRRT